MQKPIGLGRYGASRHKKETHNKKIRTSDMGHSEQREESKM